MASRTRLAVTLSVFAAALLFTGCTSTPDSGTDPDSSTSNPGGEADDMGDIEGVLLDEGRMFAVVTWGSSTCAPQVDEVSADGQAVTVTLVDPDGEGDAEKACTADMAARASVGELPEGVDPTTDVTLQVTYGDLSDDVELSGNASFVAVPGTPTENKPSAGWFEDGGLVLLTWGSSGCPPVVESLEGAGAAATATFVTNDTAACTMDMAPRTTILSFADDEVEEDGFTLTMVGGGLDGTVTVAGD